MARFTSIAGAFLALGSVVLGATCGSAGYDPALVSATSSEGQSTEEPFC